MTLRQLRCACRAALAPLCPYHAAVRHIARLKAAGAWYRDRPLFPDCTGDTWESRRRSCSSAAAGRLTTTDHAGALVQLFNGHLAWLASVGQVVVGQRNTQSAPLALAPEVPANILHQDPGHQPAQEADVSRAARHPADQQLALPAPSGPSSPQPSTSSGSGPRGSQGVGGGATGAPHL